MGIVLQESQKRILVVDDEVDVTELLSYHLRQKGLLVRTLNDPHSAMSAVESYRPDLIILDVMLPGMSGLEVLTALRSDPENRDMPVMMLTARGRDREMAERAGADRFMTKPFSNAEILSEVRAMLERGRGPA